MSSRNSKWEDYYKRNILDDIEKLKSRGRYQNRDVLTFEVMEDCHVLAQRYRNEAIKDANSTVVTIEVANEQNTTTRADLATDTARAAASNADETKELGGASALNSTALSKSPAVKPPVINPPIPSFRAKADVLSLYSRMSKSTEFQRTNDGALSKTLKERSFSKASSSVAVATVQSKKQENWREPSLHFSSSSRRAPPVRPSSIYNDDSKKRPRDTNTPAERHETPMVISERKKEYLDSLLEQFPVMKISEEEKTQRPYIIHYNFRLDNLERECSMEKLADELVTPKPFPRTQQVRFGKRPALVPKHPLNFGKFCQVVQSEWEIEMQSNASSNATLKN